MMRVSAIIPAAGIGKRLGAGYNKQYISLRGKPMVVHTLCTVADHRQIDEIIWVVGAGEVGKAQSMVEEYGLQKIAHIVSGGEERIDSVIKGLQFVNQEADYVLVHDGARPLVTHALIAECLRQAEATGAAIAAVPVKDTIKIVDTDSGLITFTPERNHLWAAQTPQVIKRQWLLEAIAQIEDFTKVTDDSMLMEMSGKPTAVVVGSYENIKVTTPEDVQMAEMILEGRRDGENR